MRRPRTKIWTVSCPERNRSVGCRRPVFEPPDEATLRGREARCGNRSGSSCPSDQTTSAPSSNARTPVTNCFWSALARWSELFRRPAGSPCSFSTCPATHQTCQHHDLHALQQQQHEWHHRWLRLSASATQ
eukprot:53707-Rhodomonas_salina.1